MNRLTTDQIERVELKVHPLVLELTGKKTPQDGLEGKFSIYHAVAVALVEGAGGENDPTVVALRSKVLPVVTPGIDPAQVDMTIVLKDGRALHRFIAHAIGSVEVPMADRQLEDKFADSGGWRHSGFRDQAGYGRLLERESLTNAADIAKIGLGMRLFVGFHDLPARMARQIDHPASNFSDRPRSDARPNAASADALHSCTAMFGPNWFTQRRTVS
jgi:hypothetical protein